MGLDSLASLLAPPRCAACAAATDARRVLCARCESALAQVRGGGSTLTLPGRLLEVRWAGEYEGVARDLVRALKFGGRTGVAASIARALVPLVEGEPCLVPVPAAPRRRRARGFDPTDLIVRALALELGLEVRHCLARTNGPRQVGRSRAERVGDPPRVRLTRRPPAVALLIDDVLTTGATLTASALALGPSAVGARAFARALGV